MWAATRATPAISLIRCVSLCNAALFFASNTAELLARAAKSRTWGASQPGTSSSPRPSTMRRVKPLITNITSLLAVRIEFAGQDRHSDCGLCYVRAVERSLQRNTHKEASLLVRDHGCCSSISAIFGNFGSSGNSLHQLNWLLRQGMVFVLDNYDSFTYNLVQYLGELGQRVEVRRND